jgi:hypothetical protein
MKEPFFGIVISVAVFCGGLHYGDIIIVGCAAVVGLGFMAWYGCTVDKPW